MRRPGRISYHPTNSPAPTAFAPSSLPTRVTSTQYRYDQATGRPECQWNGPSWPFQTSQALTGLANLLDDYPAAAITAADYLRLLRQYTHQHFLSPGKPDIRRGLQPGHRRAYRGPASIAPLLPLHLYRSGSQRPNRHSTTRRQRPGSRSAASHAPRRESAASAISRCRISPITITTSASFTTKTAAAITSAAASRSSSTIGASPDLARLRPRGDACRESRAPTFHQPRTQYRRIDLAVNPGFPYGPSPAHPPRIQPLHQSRPSMAACGSSPKSRMDGRLPPPTPPRRAGIKSISGRLKLSAPSSCISLRTANTTSRLRPSSCSIKATMAGKTSPTADTHSADAARQWRKSHQLPPASHPAAPHRLHEPTSPSPAAPRSKQKHSLPKAQSPSEYGRTNRPI